MAPVRVLIADDEAISRTGLAMLVDSIDGATVVGTATDGEECIRLATELRPDVALLDLRIPVLNGIETTRRLQRMRPQVGVLVVTLFGDDASVFPALRAGARGYLLKNTDMDELSHAIHTVARGGAIFSQPIALRVLRYLANSPPRPVERAFHGLTVREREVLEFLARGLTNGQIAEKVGISSKTVSNHVSNILFKVDAEDRARLMLMALEAGMGKPHAAEAGRRADTG